MESLFSWCLQAKTFSTQLPQFFYPCELSTDLCNERYMHACNNMQLKQTQTNIVYNYSLTERDSPSEGNILMILMECPFGSISSQHMYISYISLSSSDQSKGRFRLCVPLPEAA